MAVVVLVGTTAVAVADDYEPVNPSFPDPHAFDPQLKVSPSDALADNQTVQVTGRFLGVDTTGGVVRECTADLARCDARTVAYTTGTNGEVNPVGSPQTPADPPSIPVAFVVHSGFVAGTSVDCLVTACVVNAFRPDPFDPINVSHHITFARPGRFTPLTPARILDTRVGIGGISVPIGPAATVQVQVTGQGGIPASSVSAVAMNVTATQPSVESYVTLYPTGSPQPNASNLNVTPGETVPNLVVVKVGTGGKVSVFNSAGTTQLIFDVAGYYSDAGVGNAGRYQPLVPARIVDTRFNLGGTVLGPGAHVDLQVAGVAGVPAAGAQAAVLQVAVTNTTAFSFLTIYPTGAALPNASNVNFNAGETVSNRTMTKLGTGGMVTIYNNSGSTDVVVDVGGWYTDASVGGVLGTFVALPPARILDTRLGIGGISGQIPPGTTVDVQITGQGDVPTTGVRGVVLNATVFAPDTAGYLTVYPKGVAVPNASDLNFAAGETRPNLVVVQVGTGGKVSVTNSTPTYLIFDVAGWFS